MAQFLGAFNDNVSLPLIGAIFILPFLLFSGYAGQLADTFSKRGERLVVLYSRPDMAPATLWERLRGTDLPRLWLPRREDIFVVAALPVLATGKPDVQRAQRLAQERGRRHEPVRLTPPARPA